MAKGKEKYKYTVLKIVTEALRSVVLFLRSDKFKVLLSLTFLFVAAYLLLAFTSFLFTWKVDQSSMYLTWSQLLADSNITIENWAGKTGAHIAHLFIHEWFGIPSFGFIFLIGLSGFRIIRIRLLPLRKTTRYTFLAIFWLSLAFGFLFGDSSFYLGGAHGYYISKWLNSFIGKFGTAFLLFISLFAFIITTFENALSWLQQKMISTRDRAREISFAKEEKDAGEIIENEVDDIINNESKENQFSFSVDSLNPKVNKPGADDIGDVGFEIEELPEMEQQEAEQKNTSTNSERQHLGHEQVVEEEENQHPLGDFDPFDPHKELSSYVIPPVELLIDHKITNSEVSKDELESNKDRIVTTLNNFKIDIVKIKAMIGPTITLYEIVPAPGVRISKIKNLEDDIALSLAALGIRIIAPMPGRGTIGIEVPNQHPQIVSMRSVISSSKFQNSKFELPIALGKTISNESYVFDLVKMPHLLVAGATGQGKSVGLNAILASLLYKKHPSELKLVLIDPKKVELTLYEKIEKHYLAKLPDTEEAIITDNQQVIHTLNSLNIEMDDRYSLLKDAQVRNIVEYNAKFKERKLNPENGHKYLPYIVLVIDEFADLIMTAGKDIEHPIARLAQLARAIGIHLIVATQRPSTNIITGVIKANFPGRIAFKVASMIDSRTILDAPGANQLIGRGDMLISQGSELIRVQCAFIDTPELEQIVNNIASQQSYTSAFILPECQIESENEARDTDLSKRDDLFEDAARVVVLHQQGSTSMIQRKLSIGYARAGRIIDQLEAAGIVGPFEGSKARQVLYVDEYALEKYLNIMNAEPTQF